MTDAARVDYVIRRAEPRDLEALLELCREHAEFERAGLELDGKDLRLSDALFSAAPRLHAWVVSRGSELMGYATASLEYSTWAASEYLHMDCLFMRAAARGTGLGAALLGEVLAFARQQGLVEVQWQTPDWNEDACRFYRRQGGIDQGKRRFTLAIAK